MPDARREPADRFDVVIEDFRLFGEDGIDSRKISREVGRQHFDAHCGTLFTDLSNNRG